MSEQVGRTQIGDALGRVPPRVGESYVVVAFFLLPAIGFVLTGGQRPPGPMATAILWGVVVHHSVFLLVSAVE